MDAVDLYRIVSAPRPPDPGTGADDPTPAQVLAALTASHTALAGVAGAVLVAGRIRPPGRPDVRVLAGGRPWFPPAADGTTLLFPPGSQGEPQDGTAWDELVGSLPSWVACAGQDDVLWSPGGTGRPPSRSSFDDYMAHLPGAFGWLVLAEPLPGPELEQELAALAVRIPALRKRESSEPHRVELAGAEARYRELRRARVTGLWRVRLLAGGETPAAARSTAALLCGASELDDLPYVLIPGTREGAFAGIADTPVDVAGCRSPFVASSELVAALARPPSRELPGIRLADPPTFDVTPELSGAGIPLGDVLDGAGRPCGTFSVPLPTLNRHAFVCGATGSGKSQTMRTVLEGLTRTVAIPWLVVEPAKAEYARMAGRLAGAGTVTVIRPGDPHVAPASLNPLEPEPGFPLQSHADLVRALFLAAFDADEPFPQILSRALTRVYTAAGWDLVTGAPLPPGHPTPHVGNAVRPGTGRYPTLRDLQRTASTIVEQVGYGPEITANVRGFVDVRMGSLQDGTPGRFFQGGHPLDIATLLTTNVVLELEDITHDQDKAFLIGALLIRLVEHLRVRARDTPSGGLRHVLVVEEAHRLLRNDTEGPAASAVELFASLLAEIRAYGEGVVVVEQIPSKILPDVIKNSALKIVHRLPAADDRDVVGATINLGSRESEQVVAFAPGVAAVAVDGMDRPVRTRVTHREHAESNGRPNRAAPLASIRSPLCAADCAVSPCTLDGIAAAARTALGPRLTVWVEAVAICLVTGLVPLSASARLVEELSAVPARRLACAVAHAVERAVAARAPGLRSWVDVGEFGARVRDVVTASIDGREIPSDEPWRFTAEFYRWRPVLFALIEAESAGGGDRPPHPDTDRWASWGMPLHGRTIGEQLAELRADPSFRPGADRVAVGDLRTSGLVEAVTQLTGGHTADASGLDAALRGACAGHARPLVVELVGDLV